jgi:hypothetical protein
MSANDEIDDLLANWWWWSHESEPVKGYADTAAGFGEYRSGWRDSVELADAAEDRARDAISESVDFCIASIDLRARIAINTEMRDRFSGAKVWSSIRLPGSLADEYARAKTLLRPALEARFLIDPL